jgi:hypothetical protein
MRTSRKDRYRPYVVARGGACVFCKAHDWRAFKDPEERDALSPCTRAPILTIWARTKPEAVEEATRRFNERR